MRKEAEFLKKFVTLLLLAAFLILPASAASDDKEEELRLPIVMYHHLSPKTRLQGDYVLSPDELETDLQYLQDHGYESITTEQLIRWSKGKASFPKSL